MVRIPVARPLVSAISMVAFGAALLVGGSTDRGPTLAAPPTGPAQGAATSAASDAGDWDVTPRGLVDGTGLLTIDQVLAGPLQVATLAASLHTGIADLSSGSTSQGSTNVPVILWSAYRSAVASAPASCRLPVELLAAIGQVESGSLSGRHLDSRHRAVPAVLGPVLNGGSFAAIHDTDDGRLDGDTTWDRAVGPMQFIPSTWQTWSRDGNADGVRDPQNVEDSAHSAAAYLCAGGRDLSTSADLRSAILSYNHSDVYLADVLRLMKTVSPGGAVPRSVVTLPFAPAAPFAPSAPTPVVGPPSRPPVLAAARPTGPTGPAVPRPAPTSFSTSAPGGTTTSDGPRPTSSTTSTWPPTSNPTATWTPTQSSTSASTTSPATTTPTGSSTATTGTPGTSTPSPSSCSTPTTTDSPTTASTGSSTTPSTPTASSTTDIPAPASTTSTGNPTGTPPDTPTSSGTTTGDPTPDPCATTPTGATTGGQNQNE